MTINILITGASTGFGRNTAEALARLDRYNVFASMRDVQGKNLIHANALNKLGIQTIELDVTSDASVERAFAEINQKAGSIDILINNAGTACAGITEAFTSEQAGHLFDTNVVGLLRTIRGALPAMREKRSGLIINVGSVLGRVTFPFFGLYGASKMAVEAFTDSLRYEVSQLGVEVALVQPSAYPTNMYADAQQPADADRALAYGAIGEIPGAMFTHFTSVFSGSDAPNPHDVTETIVDLISMAKGTRPARTIVGAPFGADTINDQTAPIQAQVVSSLGLGHLSVLV